MNIGTRTGSGATEATIEMTGMKQKPGDGPVGAGKADGLGTNSEIGRKLKQYYDELVTDSVPDRFLDLLKQLDSTEGAKAKE